MIRAFSTPLARLAAIAFITLLSGLPASVYAQPSYAQSGDTVETIQGTIYQVTGRYTLTLEDDRGFIDNVSLHNGTVITPTGLALGSGEIATLTGHTSGKTFEADEIDVDPSSVSSGQAVLPGGDYGATPSYGADYPAYAFGYDPAYGSVGSSYFGQSSYYGGGYYAPTGYYPGYGYGYGNGNGRGGTVAAPGGSTTAGNPVENTPRRPVRVPAPGSLPPGYAYPTSGNRAAPPVYRGAPIVRSNPAPAAPRSAPAAAAATTHSR